MGESIPEVMKDPLGYFRPCRSWRLIIDFFCFDFLCVLCALSVSKTAVTTLQPLCNRHGVSTENDKCPAFISGRISLIPREFVPQGLKIR